MPAINLTADLRDSTGRKRNRRLRGTGKVPAVLYGHGEPCVNLALPRDAVWGIVRQGAHLVELSGAVTHTALIREVQWNTFGTEILHLDLNRVSKDDRVRIHVPVELKGDAPGVKAGGVVQHVAHSLEIEVPVINIIDRFEVRLTSLELDHAIHAREVKLPEGAKLLSDPDTVIATCALPRLDLPEPTAAAPAAEGAEPEVIAKKKEEEGEAEEE
jgi:large subunit ribosomal protein L25